MNDNLIDWSLLYWLIVQWLSGPLKWPQGLVLSPSGHWLVFWLTLELSWQFQCLLAGLVILCCSYSNICAGRGRGFSRHSIRGVVSPDSIRGVVSPDIVSYLWNERSERIIQLPTLMSQKQTDVLNQGILTEDSKSVGFYCLIVVVLFIYCFCSEQGRYLTARSDSASLLSQLSLVVCSCVSKTVFCFSKIKRYF